MGLSISSGGQVFHIMRLCLGVLTHQLFKAWMLIRDTVLERGE
ncbi:hypothetical protein S1OALGB6SA_511 [Olavius algarvensis spirochete endosymbiont]|nr:hypothetical protein S1OALGB6SA_511 [Olavius algarvensis spirochete endosymbiont]